MTDVDNIEHWRARHAAIPGWRRKLSPSSWRASAEPSFKQQKESSYNWGWLLFVAIIVLPKLFSGPGTDHTPASKSKQEYTQSEKVENLITVGNQNLNDDNFVVAIGVFSRAIDLDPNAVDALNGRAMAYLGKGDTPNAQADLIKVESIAPGNAVAMRTRGQLADYAARYDEAVAAYTRALVAAHNDPYALSLRARAYERTGKLDAALEDTDALLQLHPYSTSAYLIRGRVYLLKGDKVKAEALANTAAGLSGQVQLHRVAATIFTMLGKKDQAITVLEQSAAATPNVDTFLLLVMLRDRSDFNGRRRNIEAALQLAPKSVAALLQQAELEVDAGNVAAAIKGIDAAVEGSEPLGQDRALFYGLRSFAQLKAGNVTASAADLASAHQVAANSTGLNNLCWYLATKNYGLTSALASCDAALQRDSGNAMAMDSKAFTLLRMGQYRQSIGMYDAALRIRPDIPASLYGRGIARRRLGDMGGSATDLNAARMAYPGVDAEFASFGTVP